MTLARRVRPDGTHGSKPWGSIGSAGTPRRRARRRDARARRAIGVGRGFAVVLVGLLAAVVLFAVVAIGSTSDKLAERTVTGIDGHRRTYVNGELVRFDGAGPERWAARARELRRLADARARRLELRLELMRRRFAARLETLPPRMAIRLVFGTYAGQALAVSSCETGGTYSTSATNGQYLGLFQMGSNERATYGEGSSPLEQTLAAYVYFVVTGRDWGPWQCKP